MSANNNIYQNKNNNIFENIQRYQQQWESLQRQRPIMGQGYQLQAFQGQPIQQAMHAGFLGQPTHQDMQNLAFWQESLQVRMMQTHQHQHHPQQYPAYHRQHHNHHQQNRFLQAQDQQQQARFLQAQAQRSLQYQAQQQQALQEQALRYQAIQAQVMQDQLRLAQSQQVQAVAQSTKKKKSRKPRKKGRKKRRKSSNPSAGVGNGNGSSSGSESDSGESGGADSNSYHAMFLGTIYCNHGDPMKMAKDDNSTRYETPTIKTEPAMMEHLMTAIASSGTQQLDATTSKLLLQVVPTLIFYQNAEAAKSGPTNQKANRGVSNLYDPKGTGAKLNPRRDINPTNPTKLPTCRDNDEKFLKMLLDHIKAWYLSIGGTEDLWKVGCKCHGFLWTVLAGMGFHMDSNNEVDQNYYTVRIVLSLGGARKIRFQLYQYAEEDRQEGVKRLKRVPDNEPYVLQINEGTHAYITDPSSNGKKILCYTKDNKSDGVVAQHEVCQTEMGASQSFSLILDVAFPTKEAAMKAYDDVKKGDFTSGHNTSPTQETSPSIEEIVSVVDSLQLDLCPEAPKCNCCKERLAITRIKQNKRGERGECPPTTCADCASKDSKNEYVKNLAACHCGASRYKECSECFDCGGYGCQHPGCDKVARAEGKTKFCVDHGGGKRCQHPGGCNKSAKAGHDYCIRHGGGKRCQHQGCDKSAIDGYDFCKAHGGGKRCQDPRCNKSARSGHNYCTNHGGGERCQHPGGCNKGAQGSTKFCIDHGGGKRCQHQGCNKGARAGYDCCIDHGGGKRCQEPGGCNKSVQHPTNFCKTHGAAFYGLILYGVMKAKNKGDLVQELLSRGLSSEELNDKGILKLRGELKNHEKQRVLACDEYKNGSEEDKKRMVALSKYAFLKVSS